MTIKTIVKESLTDLNLQMRQQQLAHLPESLRKKCAIVDTTKMSKVRKEGEEEGSETASGRDSGCDEPIRQHR